MATKVSSILIRSDLLQFFQEKEGARNNFINILIHVFPQYKGNIASFRKDRSSGTLVIWIINHPESIPELKKYMEKNDGKPIVDKITGIALEHGISVTTITTLRIKKEIQFLEAWAKYDIDALIKTNEQLMNENSRLKNKSQQETAGKKTLCKTGKQKDIEAIIADLHKSLVRLQKFVADGNMAS